jgi:hypothetical protein
MLVSECSKRALHALVETLASWSRTFRFAALSLKRSQDNPEVQPNSYRKLYDGCPANRCQTLLPLKMASARLTPVKS